MSSEQRIGAEIPHFVRTIQGVSGETDRLGVTAVEGQWESVVEGAGPQSRLLGSLEELTMEQALSLIPDIYEVGDEVTTIECFGVDLHALLGRLVWVDTTQVGGWTNIPEGFCNLKEVFASGQYALQPGLRLLPCLLKINDIQVVALGNGTSTVFMALDLESECYEPYLTHEVIKYDYALEFPAESITVQPLGLWIESRWGYSGPHIWSHSYRSNFTDEPLRIASIDSASSVVDECVMALAGDWAHASKFILDQVGFPDARPEQGIRPGFMDEVDYGHRISINLPESELQQILTRLRKVDYRHARLFEGLENQDSAFGRILYSWAEAICADEAIQYDLILVLDGQEERTYQEYRAHEEAEAKKRLIPKPGLEFDPNVTNPFTGEPYRFD